MFMYEWSSSHSNCITLYNGTFYTVIASLSPVPERRFSLFSGYLVCSFSLISFVGVLQQSGVQFWKQMEDSLLCFFHMNNIRLIIRLITAKASIHIKWWSQLSPSGICVVISVVSLGLSHVVLVNESRQLVRSQKNNSSEL